MRVFFSMLLFFCFLFRCVVKKIWNDKKEVGVQLLNRQQLRMRDCRWKSIDRQSSNVKQTPHLYMTWYKKLQKATNESCAIQFLVFCLFSVSFVCFIYFRYVHAYVGDVSHMDSEWCFQHQKSYIQFYDGLTLGIEK